MRRVILEPIRKRWAPLLLAALVLSVTLVVFFYVRDDIERDAHARFERQAVDAKHIIERRMHAYVNVTYGLGALFGSHDAISRAEFHRYVAALDLKRNYPGFEVLNFARHVRAHEKDEFVAAVRRGGFPEFAIRPPGDRPEYHVLVYLEPMNRNRFAFGLDIAADATQAAGISRRRDTGELFSSGRLFNIGPEKAVGLAMRLPVYRNDAPVGSVAERRAAFIGTVGAGYNVRNLMAGVLGDTTMKSMRYRFYEEGSIAEPMQVGAGPVLLFDSAQTGPGAPSEDFAPPGAEQSFETELPLQLAGRHWKLRFNAPRSAFVQRTDGQLPWVVLAGGLLCSTMLFAVVYAFASARERAMTLAEEISAQAIEAQRANAAQIRDLLRRLVFAQETERRRFSADLHDLVGQSLTVIGMGIETLRRLTAGTLAQKADLTFDEMAKVLKETVGSVREVMADLRPPLLDDYGLYAAIEWHARQITTRTGLRVEVGGIRLEPRPPAEVEVALFRIAQEALTNVVKHADATQARISLTSNNGCVRLVVEDDGRGVARAANDAETLGWGMAVMRERAAAVGGAMRVESRGRGTRIVIEVAP